MRVSLVLIFVWVLVGCNDRSQPATAAAVVLQLPKTPIETLQTIPMFAFGGIYEDGRRSDGEIAFRSVITNANASEMFSMILTKGTTEAKLYALCAVRRLSLSDFETQAGKLDPNAPVNTMQGCIGMSERAADVLARIRAGYYDGFVSDTAH